MKRIKLIEEAEQLNVSVDDAKRIFERSISEGKIGGMMDYKNNEVISYKPEQLTELAKSLVSGRFSLQRLSDDLTLRKDQVRLVIDKLLQDKRIKGYFTSNDAFLSEAEAVNLVAELAEKSGRIDETELGKKLMVQEEVVSKLLCELSTTVVNAASPYKQVTLADLADETKLPVGFITILLKQLISEGKIRGSLDTINHTLTIERISTILEATEKREIDGEEIGEGAKSKPLGGWAIIVYFLGSTGIVSMFLTLFYAFIYGENLSRLARFGYEIPEDSLLLFALTLILGFASGLTQIVVAWLAHKLKSSGML